MSIERDKTKQITPLDQEHHHQEYILKEFNMSYWHSVSTDLYDQEPEIN